METLYAGATGAATPGVEALVSALAFFNTTEWLWLLGFVVLPGLLAVTLAVLGHRDRRPDMVSRQIAQRSQAHRASQGGGS